jgi:hypothetical protein
MADEPTCGQGLASHAALPQVMGELMDAVADNLSAHLPGLVSRDDASVYERRVYERLEAQQRDAAAMLRAIGTEMSRHRDMPMGEHDLDAMSPRDVTEALRRMVRAERQLVARLQEQLTEHQAMLDAMGS